MYVTRTIARMTDVGRWRTKRVDTGGTEIILTQTDTNRLKAIAAVRTTICPKTIDHEVANETKK